MAEVEVAPDKVGLRLLKQSGETVTYQFAPGSTVGDVKRYTGVYVGVGGGGEGSEMGFCC